VQGRTSPGRAVERGLRRVFVRLIGLPTRRWEARTPSFRRLSLRVSSPVVRGAFTTSQRWTLKPFPFRIWKSFAAGCVGRHARRCKVAPLPDVQWSGDCGACSFGSSVFRPGAGRLAPPALLRANHSLARPLHRLQA
jgi:hypothetical protein